jgi:hypothetical protein
MDKDSEIINKREGLIMMRRLLIWTLLIIIISLTDLYAQRVSVYGSLSIPTVDFAKNLGDNPKETRREGFDVGDDAGFASIGGGIGAEITVLTGLKGLTWNSGFTFIVNSTDASGATKAFKNILGDTVDVKFEFGNWIQLPIMTGLKYSYNLSDNWQLYGIAQIGLTIIKAPTRTATVSGNIVDERTYDISQEFGYSFGVGMAIFNDFDLGLRYFNFRSPKFNGERTLSMSYFNRAYEMVGTDVILGEEFPVSFLLITAGYHF